MPKSSGYRNPKRRKKIEKLLGAGMSQIDVARKLGLTIGTVHYYKTSGNHADFQELGEQAAAALRAAPRNPKSEPASTVASLMPRCGVPLIGGGFCNEPADQGCAYCGTHAEWPLAPRVK